MTGFASAGGHFEGWSWSCDLRSVNGKGLDLRLRVPDWIEGLEAGLRGHLQAALARGNVSLGLRVERAGASEAVDHAAIARALAQVAAIEEIAAREGHALAPMRAGDILAMRAPPEPTGTDETAALKDAILAQVAGEVIPAFVAARLAEGRALHATLVARLDEIADLVGRAEEAAQLRQAGQGDALRAAVARVSAEVEVDPDRLAQELALIAVKQDITEELDRLTAHVEAARQLVAGEGPKGRKLDFLMQEFNREANTLCAKSQDAALTAIGLDLKTVIDQLREQVQNVE